MTRRALFKAVALVAALALAATARADELLMARSKQAFPEAMLTLQNAIQEHGYTITRVQRVDVGLTKAGFKTGKYRVVFFGKPKEVRMMTREYPETIPYMPLKFTIFAQNDTTLVLTYDPALFNEMVHDHKHRKLFARWRRDELAILKEVRETDQ